MDGQPAESEDRVGHGSPGDRWRIALGEACHAALAGCGADGSSGVANAGTEDDGREGAGGLVDLLLSSCNRRLVLHAALLRWWDEGHGSGAGSQEEQGTDHGCEKQIKMPNSWFSLAFPLEPSQTHLLSFGLNS
eukprot:s2978_g10.t1